MKNNILFLSGIFFIIFGCSPYPSKVNEVLNNSGKNRKELEEVINHYRQSAKDSLKLKAVYFLIENMEDHFYYNGKLLDAYDAYSEEIYHGENPGNDRTLFEQYESKYGRLIKENLTKVYDREVITSQYLVNNIEWAFKVWQEQPWGKKVSLP